jgi:hypothetical protein
VKFNRNCDYKRALCENPEVIQNWFRLVEDMKAEHGIYDEDTYNFGMSGFTMGMMSTRAVVVRFKRRG